MSIVLARCECVGASIFTRPVVISSEGCYLEVVDGECI